MKRLMADLRRNRAVLALAGLALVLGLALLQIRRLPIGMHFWDQIILVQAVYRMDLGHVPNADFVSPLGALSLFWYWLASHLPGPPNPLLGGQILSSLALLPALVAALWGKRRSSVLWIFLPFLVFAFLPFNYHWLGPIAADGGVMDAGVYNREAALGLYVFVALLQNTRLRWRSGVFAYVLLFLFFTKISFALAALLLLVVWALPARHRWIELAIALGAFLVSLVVLELTLHCVLSYLKDTVDNFGADSGNAYGRLIFYIERHFELSAGAGILLLAVACFIAHRLFRLARRGFSLRSAGAFLKTNHAGLVALCLLAGSIPLESQNTGTWDFIYLWPAVIGVIGSPLQARARLFAQGGLIVVFAPIFLQTLYRTLWVLAAMRSGVSTTAFFPDDFQTYIPTSAKTQNLLERGLIAFDLMHAAAGVYAENSAKGRFIDAISPDDPSWHVAYLASLKGTDIALRRILDARAAGARHLLVLDAVDPFTRYFHLAPYLDLPYFLDPTRYLGGATLVRLQADAASADIVIVPKCPVTLSRHLIAKAIPPAVFEGRTAVPLNECWLAFVKAD